MACGRDRVVLAGLLALSLGCTGSITIGNPTSHDAVGSSGQGGATSPGGSGPFLPPPSGGSASSTPSACASPDVGPTPLRRLTRSQYDATVAALLGDTSAPARGFSPDETLLGFAAGLSVSPLLVEQMMDAAEKLAATAVTNLPKLLGCDPKTGEDACANKFIDAFGQRAYRRPLTDDERADVRALYATNKASAGFAKAIELVTQALLASPQFLYRLELGKPTTVAGVVALDDWELASRLSYLLWGSMPDEALFQAAAAGKLSTPAGLAAEADRMLNDAKASAVSASFFGQWLDLDRLGSIGKDSKLYPGFDDNLRGAMRGETLSFVDAVMHDDGKLSTLLGAPWSMVNATVAPIYGMTGVTSAAPVKQQLPSGQRFGLLTQASVMSLTSKTNQSSPIHRGVFVREQLLCQTLTPPPANLVVTAPDPAPGLSTRQRFAAHSANATCAGCHKLLDPVGFGFEGYDAVGRFRTMDGTVPVDAHGELVQTLDVDGPFNGVGELSAKLQGSREVAACLVGKWFVFAFGRSSTNERDACSVSRLGESFDSSAGDLRALIRALVATDAFRLTRREGGV